MVTKDLTAFTPNNELMIHNTTVRMRRWLVKNGVFKAWFKNDELRPDAEKPWFGHTLHMSGYQSKAQMKATLRSSHYALHPESLEWNLFPAIDEVSGQISSVVPSPPNASLSKEGMSQGGGRR